MTIAGPLSAGQHAVLARQTDAAGNVGTWSSASIWIVKLSTTIHLTGPSGSPTNSTTPTVSYVGEAGDEFTITVDGQTAVTGVIPVGGVGSLALPTPLSDGTQAIEMGVTDAGGNRASDSIVVTIDTVSPDPVTIGQAPATVTSSTAATFSFADSKHGIVYQCSLDSAAWTACQTPVTFPGLPDGPHMLLVRAVDEAGNTSTSTQYAWTINTSPPASPTISGGPSPVTTPHTTVFDLSPAPGATLQCSLDGRAYLPCPDQYGVGVLPLGAHSLAVRAIDESGNVSSPTVYHWMVIRRTGPLGMPTVANLLVAADTTATNGGYLEVGCNLNAGALHRCVVSVYHRGERVGTGTAREAKHDQTHVIVNVWLNATGRRLLARADGGLPITLAGAATPFGFGALRMTNRTVLYEPLRSIVSDVLFRLNSSRLTSTAHAIIKKIASQLAGARTVTCEGNTDLGDSYGDSYAPGLHRAQAVCAMLHKLGVKAHFGSVSYAYRRPVASNQTAAGRRLNRRVVILASYHDLPLAPAHP